MRAPWPARLHGLPLGLVAALKLVAFVALLTGAWFLSWMVSDARVKAGEPFDLQRASTIAVVVGAWLVTFEYVPKAFRRSAADPSDGLTRAFAGILGGLAAVAAAVLGYEVMRALWRFGGHPLWSALGPDLLGPVLIAAVLWGLATQAVSR